MIGQGKDDYSFSLVEEGCHNLDKHAASTYVADKVSEDPVLNGKISGDEAPFPGMLPSLRVWPTSYQLEVSLHAWDRSYRRRNVGPWAFFQGRPSGKARLSYKQALRLWSGLVEVRRPKALLISLQKSAL